LSSLTRNCPFIGVQPRTVQDDHLAGVKRQSSPISNGTKRRAAEEWSIEDQANLSTELDTRPTPELAGDCQQSSRGYWNATPRPSTIRGVHHMGAVRMLKSEENDAPFEAIRLLGNGKVKLVTVRKRAATHSVAWQRVDLDFTSESVRQPYKGRLCVSL